MTQVHGSQAVELQLCGDRDQIYHTDSCGSVNRKGLFPNVIPHQSDVFSPGDMLTIKTMTV